MYEHGKRKGLADNCCAESRPVWAVGHILREIGADVTLENAYHLLLGQSDLDEAMTHCAITARKSNHLLRLRKAK